MLKHLGEKKIMLSCVYGAEEIAKRTANDVLKSVYFALGDKQQFINMHIVVTTKMREKLLLL